MTEQTFQCLVVEDDASVAEILAQLLAHVGGQVQLCGSAKEALHQVNQEEWDLLILDQNLPDGRGTDLFATIRRNGNSTPVILMTGDVAFEIPNELKTNGYFAYLPKPCRWQFLKECLLRSGVLDRLPIGGSRPISRDEAAA